jgi:hypothetical protein
MEGSLSADGFTVKSTGDSEQVGGVDMVCEFGTLVMNVLHENPAANH